MSSQFDFELGMPGKRVFEFLEHSKGNEQVDLWMEVGTNELLG